MLIGKMMDLYREAENFVYDYFKLDKDDKIYSIRITEEYYEYCEDEECNIANTIVTSITKNNITPIYDIKHTIIISRPTSTIIDINTVLANIYIYFSNYVQAYGEHYYIDSTSPRRNKWIYYIDPAVNYTDIKFEIMTKNQMNDLIDINKDSFIYNYFDIDAIYEIYAMSFNARFDNAHGIKNAYFNLNFTLNHGSVDISAIKNSSDLVNHTRILDCEKMRDFEMLKRIISYMTEKNPELINMDFEDMIKVFRHIRKLNITAFSVPLNCLGYKED